MIRTKLKCDLCGQEISKSNYSKHLRRHENHPETFKNKSYKLNHDGLICQFCGKECKSRNSLCNHERLCKENPNRQIIHNEGFNNRGRVAWNKGLTKETHPSIECQSRKLHLRYLSGELKGSFTGKKHSEETKQKIPISMQKYFKTHPDKVPYILNHSSKESYPETYFKKLFLNERIEVVYHFRVNKYELDFAIPSLSIDIEIDGEQHYLDKKIIESDKRRNSYLKSSGWTIFRIRWSRWKLSDTYKEETLCNLKSIISEYSNKSQTHSLN